MGTRADFYIGRGEKAEWLGSHAWDGYPEGIDRPVLEATDEDDYRRIVGEYLTARRDATLPEMGWPWPWDDSRTTDYAYAFDGGKVWGSCFGHQWFDPLITQPEDEDGGKVAVFPDMSALKNVAFDKRSGVIILGGI